MQPTEKPVLISVRSLLASFPKGHMLAAGALAACLVIWANSSPSQSSSLDETLETVGSDRTVTSPATADTLEFDLAEATPELLLDPIPGETTAAIAPVDTTPLVEEEPVAAPELTRKAFTVKSGDSMALIFSQIGRAHV